MTFDAFRATDTAVKQLRALQAAIFYSVISHEILGRNVLKHWSSCM